MDSLIPFTTSGSLVDCVDSTFAPSPSANPVLSQVASTRTPLPHFCFVRKDARRPARWPEASWRAALL